MSFHEAIEDKGNKLGLSAKLTPLHIYVLVDYFKACPRVSTLHLSECLGPIDCMLFMGSWRFLVALAFFLSFLKFYS